MNTNFKQIMNNVLGVGITTPMKDIIAKKRKNILVMKIVMVSTCPHHDCPEVVAVVVDVGYTLMITKMMMSTPGEVMAQLEGVDGAPVHLEAIKLRGQDSAPRRVLEGDQKGKENLKLHYGMSAGAENV